MKACFDIIKRLNDRMITCLDSEIDGLDICGIEKATASIHYNLESLYYCTVIDAMEKGSERYGYTPPKVHADWMTDAKGRLGYRPMVDQQPYIDNYISSDYGREYDEWRDAKRHYTETKSMEDKKRMNEHTKTHVDNTMMSIKEMWEDADPQLRSEIKSDLMSLLNTL